MLAKYNCKNVSDYRNALKEISQEVALCGLSRGGFFDKAAFYGGTALRIFYGLDRFSEDLDFSLIKPDEGFELSRYFGVLEEELYSVGLEMSVEAKSKPHGSPVQSAFLKGNTLSLARSRERNPENQIRGGHESARVSHLRKQVSAAAIAFHGSPLRQALAFCGQTPRVTLSRMEKQGQGSLFLRLCMVYLTEHGRKPAAPAKENGTDRALEKCGHLDF